jgi:inorganic pyrophosphatase
MKLTIFLLFLVSFQLLNLKSFSERKKNSFSSSFDNFSTLSNKKVGKKLRVFLISKLKIKSFWHYINLQNTDNTYNMVIEIPKKTRAKFELSKEEKKNPIKQDIDKSTKNLRFYKIDPIFNYGFFPQTWENSAKTYFGKYKGDDDPYDVVEIGKKRYKTGQVVKVRVLGAFCLIDHGEVDWKILVINNKEYEDYQLNKRKYRKKFKKIMNWFKIYKTYEGKKVNKIMFNDKIFSIRKTKKLIEEGYNDYLKLKSLQIKGVDYKKYHL